MAKFHRPVKGSRAYWPRKRAARMRTGFRSHEGTLDHAGVLEFAGYKAGMTQVQVIDGRKTATTAGQTITRSVTVIAAPKLQVIGITVYKKNGRTMQAGGRVWAENLPKGLQRTLSVPEKTPTKEKMAQLDKISGDFTEVRLLCCTVSEFKKAPDVFEMSLGGTAAQQWTFAKEKIGKELAATEVFKEGEWVDVQAVSTGKGTAGVVERFGVRIRGRKSKKKQRHIGNIGTRGVQRVLPGKIAFAGQLGFQTRTEYNKRVLKIGTGGVTPEGGWVGYGQVNGDYVLLSGSVPGPRKRLILIRKGIRTHVQHTEPDVVEQVFLYSQQGK